MPFTPSWLVNLIILLLTAATFVLACVTACVQLRAGNSFLMRLSMLWAVGLGLYLFYPVYTRIFVTFHNGVGTVSNPMMYWLNALGFICIIVATGISLRQPYSKSSS